MKCNGKMLFCKISNSFNNFFAVKRWNNPKYKDGRGSLFCTTTIVYAEMSRGCGDAAPYKLVLCHAAETTASQNFAAVMRKKV